MPEQISFGEFTKRYNTDAACLEEIVQQRYPNGITCRKCKKVTKHYKVKKRPVYCCKICRAQVSPLVGTIFERTKVPLTDWFYAIFLMVQTRSGLPATELQRSLKVNYNTAWRMLKQLREVMGQDQPMLSGIVEIDEVYIGGDGYWRGKEWWQNWEEHPKETVMGFVERGGRMRIKYVPNNDTSAYAFLSEVKKHVAPGSTIYTDKHSSYRGLQMLGYNHKWVNHSKHYVDNEVHTQNIEGYWSHLKTGLKAVYRHVSIKHMQLYGNEFAWRYSHRKEPDMFSFLLKKAVVNAPLL